MYNNSDRAKRASFALTAYSKQDHPSYMEEPIPTRIADLLCDTLHLAERAGLDIETVLQRARMNYEAEVEEEKEELFSS